VILLTRPTLLQELEARDGGIAEVHPPNREGWRSWLLERHASEEKVWHVYHKQTSGMAAYSYSDAVEEALCFGWIDGKVQSLDERRYRQLFCRRSPKSSWSKVNKDRVAKLREAGLMTPAGEAAIAVAQENGSWSSLDAVEGLVVPHDLEHALHSNPRAKAHFQAFPPSSRKNILRWIYDAKSADTRIRRVNEAVEKAELNVRAR
jgi:uncharacterized protein YdeI (YjbR/CyaY-like superfamily)